MKNHEIEKNGLPVSVEAEQMILGNVLMRGAELFESVSTLIRADEFALEKHRLIFSAFDALVVRGESIDSVSVYTELLRWRHHETVGGLSYLAELNGEAVPVSSVESYCRIVRRQASLRRLIHCGQQLIDRAASAQEEPEVIADSLVSQIREIDNPNEAEWKTAIEIVGEYPGGWNALVSPASQQNQMGVQLPWCRVQDVVCGLQKGEMVIVAGRPSMGKSAFAMQVAIHAAKQHVGVAYVSLEMTGPALVRREISQTARVDSVRMRLGYLNADERGRLVNVRDAITQLPLHIESKQRRGRTVGAIVSSLRALRAKTDIGLVVIDHFHLIDGPEREERIKYNRIADAIQRAARDMEIPFVLLAQLNRKCEEERREPGIADLKECGKLEENADVVIFIHRPEMYAHLRDRDDLRGAATVIIAKQRDGATGKAELIFLHSLTRFESRAEDLGESVQ